MQDHLSRLDPRLVAVVSDDEVTAEDAIDSVLRDARPFVDRILSSKRRRTPGLQGEVWRDLRNEVMLRLLRRLRMLRNGGSNDVIESFKDYVAVVTYHVFNDALRAAYPERSSLKNKVRYVVTTDRRYETWETTEGDTIVSRRGARQRPPHFEPIDVTKRCKPEMSIRALVEQIVDSGGGSFELEALVDSAALVRRTFDVPTSALPSESTREPVSHLERMQHREKLSRLWEEVTLLPIRQRIALLLNIRDASGEAMVHFFPATGIASIHQIADVLQLPFDTFSILWDELPVEDNRIAAMLGLTRQQVINLRKSARDRLARRMAKNLGRSFS